MMRMTTATTMTRQTRHARATHRASASARASTSSDANVATWFSTGDTRPVILYDGVCNLCNGGVNFAIDMDAKESGSVRFAALQSDVGRALLRNCGRSADDISSIVFVVSPTRAYVKSEAVLRIAEYMKPPLPTLGGIGLMFPTPLGDFVYDLVADNRYNILGVRDECRLGRDDEFKDRFLY